MNQKLCILDVVGLTPDLLGEHTPNLNKIAETGETHPLEPVFPAVTLPPQASFLTGNPPSKHGIVGNGWMYRGTREIRFWQQARSLVNDETLYEKADRWCEEECTTALLFYWFSQGARSADYRVFPKPHYGTDGNKLFDIHGAPDSYTKSLKRDLGAFPFHRFWGPTSGPGATEWIADATEWTLRNREPDLTLTYLPALDYPAQKYGPDQPETIEALEMVDDCVGRIREAARERETEVMVFSEYGLTPVTQPLHPNRWFREQDWLKTRDGPFGEQLDTHRSSVVAASDHQISHIYVDESDRLDAVRSLLENKSGVEQVWGEQEKQTYNLNHPRSGELIAIADPDAWFTYYFWKDNRHAPDYARSVKIHDKPGFDPVELFFDPDAYFPRAQMMWMLLKKYLGFRYRMDLIPLDASLVRGSHGRPPETPGGGPLALTPFDLPADPTFMDLHDQCLAHLLDT